MRIGFTVRLRSGGPEMTIIAMSRSRKACLCAYFDAAGVMQQTPWLDCATVAMVNP